MNNALARKRKVLVIDDMPNNIRILESFLKKNDYEVYSALDGVSGLEMARDILPDLILLDIMMPEMDGYDTCKEIRAGSELADIPVIFITAKNQQEDIIKAFESGGNDYIVKPFFFQEVLLRIKVHIENKLLREELYEMSMKDHLTEIWNRRYFIENAHTEFDRSLRYDRKLCFAICDIDNFKQVNDKYGHCVGDEVLKKTAKGLANLVRHSDCVGRWGGEEFVILFTETCKNDAMEFLERIRCNIAKVITSTESDDVSITLSFGVSCLCDLGDGTKSFDELYKIADQRLYVAKNAGKNRIVFE